MILTSKSLILVYFEFRLSSLSAMFFLFAVLLGFAKANHKYQVKASVVIRAAKPKFVAESRTRVYFVQHVGLTCNTVFCCETSWSQTW